MLEKISFCVISFWHFFEAIVYPTEKFKLSNMAENLKTCSIGQGTGEECHLLSYKKKAGFRNMDEMTGNEKELLSIRSDVSINFLRSVCLHHFETYLVIYESLQRRCCDPFNKHAAKNAEERKKRRKLSTLTSKYTS